MSKIKVSDILKKWGLGGESMQIHMKHACKELIESALDKAAENAEVDYFLEGNHEDSGYTCIHSVDQQSILKLKEDFDYE